jgi:hypothetical protein
MTGALPNSQDKGFPKLAYADAAPELPDLSALEDVANAENGSGRPLDLSSMSGLASFKRTSSSADKEVSLYG